MMRIFDDEYILKTYVESERRDVAEAAVKKLARKLFQKGNTVEDIADILEVSLVEIEQWLEDFES